MYVHVGSLIFLSWLFPMMASSTLIQVTPELHGEFSVDNLTEASAKTTSDILEENHQKHDIIFNDFGLHSKS